MTFKSYSEHTEPIVNDLKILNQQKLNEYLTSSFMFRYFHLHNLSEIFTDYFVTNKDIHNYNTRNAALLHKKFNRTNYNKTPAEAFTPPADEKKMGTIWIFVYYGSGRGRCRDFWLS